MEILEFIRQAGSLAAAGISLCTFAALFIKPLRNKIFSKIQVNDAEREGIKCLLRHEILMIYYANCEKKIIEEYDFEDMTRMYKAYKALGGNSFIDKIYKEVETTWCIEARHSALLEE
ncbi:MAG: hypothetical protein ACI4IW_05450 [Oscillospiraceae bacterium]